MDLYSFHDMHVIPDILYDSTHYRWQMTFDLGVIYLRFLIAREKMAASGKNTRFNEFAVFENMRLDTEITIIA